MVLAIAAGGGGICGVRGARGVVAVGFEDIGIFSQDERRRGFARLLLDLVAGGGRHTPVGDGGDHDGDIGRKS